MPPPEKRKRKLLTPEKLKCKLLTPSPTQRQMDGQGNTICPFHHSLNGRSIKNTCIYLDISFIWSYHASMFKVPRVPV